ncbi:DNA adenine methylase [Occultella kanbiaonis]|uniref:DNA adenine methylase n=1 Tax=Occultella kanbiaonis TaxID=2675754 RepID=UPI0013D048AA|nr:Dam family site-specific DNA-(adenine-N6)-methyltransferase [Occultella kanbiaonis]
MADRRVPQTGSRGRCTIGTTITKGESYVSLAAPESTGAPRSWSRVGRQPFLRWAGGKRWLVSYLAELTAPVTIRNYHEPFAGGAAVFFGIDFGSHSYLSDLNADLIETYAAVQDSPDKVWERLRQYRNTEVDYYAARAAKPRTPANRAARFIFLNHTSFNGLYRVNLRGEYNVPFGYKTSDNRPDLAQLRSASARLNSATLAVGDFVGALQNVGQGDLVFLDPPYTVAHNNNGFVKYNDRLFLFADQQRLSGMIDQLRDRDAYYVMTNAAHASIAELFDKGDRRVETSRKNNVGGRTAARGRATEYLFTNLPVA